MSNHNKKELSRWLSVIYKRQNNTKLTKGETNENKYFCSKEN